MQVMTQQKLDQLLSETGHALELADIALIVELDRYADAVVNGGASSDELSIYEYPLVCAGHVFYAPTIGKEIFWREQVVRAVPSDWHGVAYLWLLAQPTVPTARGIDITKAVKKWGRTCKLTTDDVNRIHAQYTNDNGAGDGSTVRRDYGEIIALLVREYGKTAHYWLNAQESEVKMMLDDWVKRQEAKAAAYRSSKAGSKNPIPPAPSPKIKAMKEFRLCSERIKEQWQKSA